MKLNLPTTDAALSTSGVWCEFGPGVEFRIARTGNSRYHAEMMRLMGNTVAARKHRRGVLTEKDAENHLRASAKAVLVDWRGIRDEDGTEWSYSEDRAYELLSDPKWAEVQEFIWSVAQDMAVFRNAVVEEAEGN